MLVLRTVKKRKKKEQAGKVRKEKKERKKRGETGGKSHGVGDQRTGVCHRGCTTMPGGIRRDWARRVAPRRVKRKKRRKTAIAHDPEVPAGWGKECWKAGDLGRVVEVVWMEIG